MGIIKTFDEWLNESVSSVKTLTDNDIRGEKQYVYSLSPEELENQLRNYVIDYYNEFPEELEKAKENNEATINWGELEAEKYVVANYVCDLLTGVDFEDKKLSHKDQKIVDLAWNIADDYVKNGYTEEPVVDEPKIEGTLEDLYHYLLDNYQNLGKEEISFKKGKDAYGISYELQIPVTLSGLKLETEPGEPGETFSVDINPELEQYLDKNTYYDIDDEILDEHGVLRVFTDPDNVTNNGIIRLLDGILKNVPDPALRKK